MTPRARWVLLSSACAPGPLPADSPAPSPPVAPPPASPTTPPVVSPSVEEPPVVPVQVVTAPPVPGKPPPPVPQLQEWQQPTCGLACPGGEFARDANGCPTCGCVDRRGILQP